MAGEEVTAFADRSYHIDGAKPASFGIEHDRHDLVMSAVERRPHEVVHGCVDNQELLSVIAFAVNDASE